MKPNAGQFGSRSSAAHPVIFGRKAKTILKPTLTKREFEVAELVVTGRDTNLSIAKVLGISEETVKAHLYNAYNKLGIDNRMHLAIWWKDREIETLQKQIAEMEKAASPLWIGTGRKRLCCTSGD